MSPRPNSRWRTRRSAVFVLTLLGFAIFATALINFLAFSVEQDVGRERDESCGARQNQTVFAQQK